MEIKDVVKIRQKLSNIKDVNNYPCAIAVIGDNMILADESKDYLSWDDENGILYIVKQNTEAGVGNRVARIQVICTSYENIQYIRTNLNSNNFADFAKNQLNYTDINVSNVMRRFYPELENFIMPTSATMGKDETVSRWFSSPKIEETKPSE